MLEAQKICPSLKKIFAVRKEVEGNVNFTQEVEKASSEIERIETKACVKLSEGYTPSKELENELKDFVNNRIASYKWIQIVEFVNEMPKTII